STSILLPQPRSSQSMQSTSHSPTSRTVLPRGSVPDINNIFDNQTAMSIIEATAVGNNLNSSTPISTSKNNGDLNTLANVVSNLMAFKQVNVPPINTSGGSTEANSDKAWKGSDDVAPSAAPDESV